MTQKNLELHVAAHCRLLAESVATMRPDQIRNRLAYIVANAEALAELKEAA